MGNFFIEIGRNRVFLATLSGWFIAQAIKVFLGVIREKRFDFRWFVGTGGMPSSHTAAVAAMATAAGLVSGFDSVLFALALIFAIIVMFDAQGVRQATGIQAEVLNKIIDDIYYKRGLREERLKELIGHTPFEVLAGAVVGVLVALVFYGILP
jgi:uncharacterized protein